MRLPLSRGENLYKYGLICAVCLVLCIEGGPAYAKSHSVRGYTKSNGSKVNSHHATNRNATKRDNWSSKGNVNPYTGKKGTKNP